MTEGLRRKRNQTLRRNSPREWRGFGMKPAYQRPIGSAGKKKAPLVQCIPIAVMEQDSGDKLHENVP